MEDKKACIVWFCEHPDESVVCRALKAGLGDEKGESIYKLLCENQAKLLREAGFPVIICFKGESRQADMINWFGPKYQYQLLGDKILSEEVENVLYHCFSKGFHFVTAVFEIMPQLTFSTFEEVLAKLEEFDTVLGSTGQGYVGLFAIYRPSFKLSMIQNVDFNSELSHMQIWENIRKAKMCVDILPDMLAVRNHFDYEALSVAPPMPEISATEESVEAAVAVDSESSGSSFADGAEKANNTQEPFVVSDAGGEEE